MESNNVIGDYKLIFETVSFKAVAPNKPHIDREDGGHIIIIKKVNDCKDRTQLSTEECIEMMLLSMAVGEAMQTTLSKSGVDIACVNYQENGNWAYLQGIAPQIHLHLYGRAKSAEKQPFGQALYFPEPKSSFYEGLEPLSETDIENINGEIKAVCKNAKYQEFSNMFMMLLKDSKNLF